MIAECLILGTGAYIAKDAVNIEYLKSKQIELSDEEKSNFLQNPDRRFIHFTSKENASKIIESGFLIPTKGILKNHFAKQIGTDGKRKNSDMVYMFDSQSFSVDDYIRNLPKDRSPFNGCFEYYAVSTRPNEYEINNFKRRAQDGAITYEGRLDIDGTDTKLVKYVLGLDEQGQYKLDEVPMDYIYNPSKELLDKLDKDKIGNLRYNLRLYLSEVKKARNSSKEFNNIRKKYKEQIKNKKDFALANKQFIEEQKEVDYVYEKNGEKIVVKNLGYEIVGGKKLQKLAMIKKDGQSKDKKVNDVSKFCFMDEWDISKLDNKVATNYFFNNFDSIDAKNVDIPEYIGLPIENLETGEVKNDLDNSFKEYIDNRRISKRYADFNYDVLNSKKLSFKIKSGISKILGKQNNTYLPESNESYYKKEKEDLARLGYSSVKAMNEDGNDTVLINNNSMEKMLQNHIQDEDKQLKYYIKNEEKTNDEKNKGIEGIGENKCL